MREPRAVAGLRAALPYLRAFRGSLFVVKFGGEAAERSETLRGVLEQAAILHWVGIRVVLVHGGGPQATALAERTGVSAPLVEGRRITSPEALSVMAQALREVVRPAILAEAESLGLPAAPLCGADSGILLAERRPPLQTASGEWVDYGRVGRLVEVRTGPIEATLAEDKVPVVCPLCADAEGGLLNLNADTAAAAIASALGAAKLVLLTGARGILANPKDPASLISELDLAGLARLVECGAAADGMRPKAEAIRAALEDGVGQAHVISHSLPDALLTEVFTNEGCGTMIVREVAR